MGSGPITKYLQRILQHLLFFFYCLMFLVWMDTTCEVRRSVLCIPEYLHPSEDFVQQLYHQEKAGGTPVKIQYRFFFLLFWTSRVLICEPPRPPPPTRFLVVVLFLIKYKGGGENNKVTPGLIFLSECRQLFLPRCTDCSKL